MYIYTQVIFMHFGNTESFEGKNKVRVVAKQDRQRLLVGPQTNFTASQRGVNGRLFTHTRGFSI